MFQITIAIGILMVALFESCHVSLKDFLHRLFDVFSHHFVEFHHEWKPSWPSILDISLHAQDCFSYEFDSFLAVDQFNDFVVTDLWKGQDWLEHASTIPIGSPSACSKCQLDYILQKGRRWQQS